jgi:FkbM family methyltransferase
MKTIIDLQKAYAQGSIDKANFIRSMYENNHSKLFEYMEYLKSTNISSIEILDKTVTMTTRDNGVRMICPIGDHRVAPVEILNFSDYEAEDSAMIYKLMFGSKVMVDIGANIGWYTVNLAKTFPRCEVHAFEPIPKTYDYLQQNVKINELHNVKLNSFGLSNARKELEFYFYPEGSGNASSVNLSESKDAELITCNVERLDDYVQLNDLKVDFIKLDVEGAELFAIEGATKTITQDRPMVFTEMLRKWSEKFNYHPNDIISLFSESGFRCFYATGERLEEIFEITEDTKQTNFFFLHAEKHQSQIKSYLRS